MEITKSPRGTTYLVEKYDTKTTKSPRGTAHKKNATNFEIICRPSGTCKINHISYIIKLYDNELPHI